MGGPLVGATGVRGIVAAARVVRARGSTEHVGGG